MLTASINLIGVIAATAVALIIGFSWYSPALFGNAWLNSITSKGKKAPKMNAFGLIMLIVSSFVTAIVLDIFIGVAHTTSIGGALAVAAIIWVGFFFPKEIVSAAMRHHGKMLAINAFHDLIALLIMAAVLIYI